MEQGNSVEWKEELGPVKTEEVVQAISDDGSWNPDQTNIGRLEEMEVYEILEEISEKQEIDSVIDVGSSRGLTTFELSRILPSASLKGIDIDGSAIDQAEKNLSTLQEYADFLNHLSFEVAGESTFKEALEEFDYDRLSFEGVEHLENFPDNPSYAFKDMARWKDLPEPVEYLSEQIASYDSWREGIMRELEMLDGLKDLTFEEAGALEMSEKGLEADMVVANNSLGTFDTKAVFSKLANIKKQNSDVYNQILDEANDNYEIATELGPEIRDATREVFMEQVLDETARVVDGNGVLLLADGRQYLELEVSNNEWSAVEGRGAVSERKRGRCSTYEEKHSSEVYDSWLSLSQIDTSNYTEKFINRSGDTEIL